MLGLVFIEKKIIRLQLTNHFLGKFEKCIQGSETKTKSVVYCNIIFFKANLDGALAKPL